MARLKIFNPISESRGYLYIIGITPSFFVGTKKYPNPFRIYKLGFTTDITTRLKVYKTHLPSAANLLFLQNMKQAKKMEQSLQGILKRYCRKNDFYHHGEWFGCSYDLIENLILYRMGDEKRKRYSANSEFIPTTRYDYCTIVTTFPRQATNKITTVKTFGRDKKYVNTLFALIRTNKDTNKFNLKLGGLRAPKRYKIEFNEYDEILDYLDLIFLKANIKDHKDKKIIKEKKLFATEDIIINEFGIF
jgi:hypothetical protein